MAVNNKTGIITRAKQKQHTRQKLIEATMEAIASEGFSGVTMAKVAEKAGLSRGIGNFHFQSKEQLLLETLHTLYKELLTGAKRRHEKNILKSVPPVIASGMLPLKIF
jgi:TetR/AcrR family transcriptional repressor of bet genes